MRILIMGTGGVGGYFGGLLARSGQDVTFVARGAHLRAILEKGLQIKSVHGDFLLSKAQATNNPLDVGPVDLILFTTKTYQTEEAVELIKPLLDPETVIISLQNGVDNADRIGALVGTEHMLGGVTWLSAAIEAPGIIGQYSRFHRIIMGEFDGKITPRLKEIHRILQDTGATIEVIDNILDILWTKFVFISSISALGAVTRVAIGDYRNVKESRDILINAIGEVVAVAHARGVTLPPDIMESTLSSIDECAPDLKASMQRDVEAGRISELESMIGTIIQLGGELGVSTPVMSFAYASLKPGLLKALENNRLK